MTKRFCASALLLVSLLSAPAQTFETVPSDPFFAPFKPLKAPPTPELLLSQGDRLAICGDSITEQKMYSRVVETYLRVARPDLDLSIRQFGWSGEKADGFLRRMTNDVLRFKPTVATTCYGMNDHLYRPYTEEIGERYRTYMTAIVNAFQDHGTRVVLGSPGSVGKVPHWTNSGDATLESLNLNLCELRNIGIQIAREEGAVFADIFWPMLTLGFEAREEWGEEYAIAGSDGVHPGWAGSFVMAYQFLKAMGLDGEIGTLVVDLEAGRAFASSGHEVKSFTDQTLELSSRRYPFCATGEVDSDNSIRSAMALVPFMDELNRLTLVVKNGSASNYTIRWGDQENLYSAERLEVGINLAKEFEDNPFCEAFQSVDEAVFRKQEYETKQIKSLFHGREGAVDMDLTAVLTEKARDQLVDAVHRAHRPVEHRIEIVPN